MKTRKKRASEFKVIQNQSKTEQVVLVIIGILFASFCAYQIYKTATTPDPCDQWQTFGELVSHGCLFN